MKILSNDVKQLVIETEKGNVVLLLPIGIQLEEALDASMAISGSIKQAVDLYKEKQLEEEKNDS